MKFVDEQKYKNNIGIYQIKNIVNNKVYIGQTKEKFQRRYWLHRWKLRNNCHDNNYLQNAWNKYGEENFVFSVLEVLSKDKIDEREQYWIKKYKELNLCYSIQEGGQPNRLCDYVSIEERKRIGELNRVRLLGTKLPEETKKKMSDARRGRHFPKKNDIIDLEQAKEIKKRLINGEKPSDIAKHLKIPYKVVNNILSCNSFETTAEVEGWENFQSTRERRRILSQEEIKEIYRLYDEIKTYRGVAKIIGKDKEVVKYHILRRNK